MYGTLEKSTKESEGDCMRHSEQFLELVNVFKEASKNLILIFLLNFAGLKFKNNLHIYRKYITRHSIKLKRF
jgi:hypothetical protein